MKLDDQIKQALEKEAQQIDKIIAHDPGLFAMLGNAFKGSLGIWFIIVSIFGFLLSLVMFWAAYQFFFVVNADNNGLMHKLHWGITLLISSMMVTALKMWTFMEMNRHSTVREIKRLELMLEKIANKMGK